jgi:prolyl-tRNA editing enzyme YbaK/EbsC (Cys-tRNA(Pro) deacylase)
MSKELSTSAQKVQDALKKFGFTCRVVELPGSARTAIEAAQAIGCQVDQIAKSLVFKGKRSKKPILVVAGGSNRVNENKLKELADEPVKKADADFVRQKTGYAIGGVPPIGHSEKLEVFIDEDLLKHEEIWAAAGTPRAVFSLKPAELPKMTGGRVVNIT